MHFDDSWFWPLLERYRDQHGSTLAEAERAWLCATGAAPDVIDRCITEGQWRLSPKSERSTRHLITLIERFHAVDDPFTYLEFGTCFGTTILSILRHFREARGIGLEANPSRFSVSRWLAECMRDEFELGNRLELRQGSILDTGLTADSVDVVFMDTDHRYPDDYDYMRCLLDRDILREGFLFAGDDPMHTGTKQARERFLRENEGVYRIETRTDQNLWWFSETAGGSKVGVADALATRRA